MSLPSAALLSAIITPAVLISACGALILSTSTRLGRSTDRARTLTGRFKELLTAGGRAEPLAAEEKALILSQIPQMTRRVGLIQQALVSFYGAVGLFVLTSVTTGVGVLAGLDMAALPVVLVLLGSGLLCFGALLLTYEARLSSVITREEMRFLKRLGEHYAATLMTEAANAGAVAPGSASTTAGPQL